MARATAIQDRQVLTAQRSHAQRIATMTTALARRATALAFHNIAGSHVACFDAQKTVPIMDHVVMMVNVSATQTGWERPATS